MKIFNKIFMALLPFIVYVVAWAIVNGKKAPFIIDFEDWWSRIVTTITSTDFYSNFQKLFSEGSQLVNSLPDIFSNTDWSSTEASFKSIFSILTSIGNILSFMATFLFRFVYYVVVLIIDYIGVAVKIIGIIFNPSILEIDLL